MLAPNNGAGGRTQAAAIRAELFGSNTATALGVTAVSNSPLIALCCRLSAAGHDPATPLDAYRGATLALRMRSIGEAARLQVNAYGTGFRPHSEADIAPPVRRNGPAGVGAAKGTRQARGERRASTKLNVAHPDTRIWMGNAYKRGRS